MNVVCMTARMARDPEVKMTQNGTSVCTFSGAVDRTYQKSGEERVCDFVTFVAWRKEADFVGKYFRKGDMISIVGELQSREYTAKDGSKRTAWEVIVSNAGFCGGKNKSANEASTADLPTPPSVAAATVAPDVDYEEITTDDELPF